MVSKKMTELQPWECLMKRIVWKQLGDIRDKKILDFGSGIGVTANYLAEHNDYLPQCIRVCTGQRGYCQAVCEGSENGWKDFDCET